MPTWSGWQTELLTAASIPFSEAVGNFLFDWSAHAEADCPNNPIDISRAAAGATNCHKLTSTRTAKNYPTHRAAAGAFATQIKSGAFPHLLAALRTPDPYQSPNPTQTAADLRKWGSTAFATYYLSHSNVGSGNPGTPSSASVEPHSHTAWVDLRHSVNKTWPNAVLKHRQVREATLRTIKRTPKVRV